MGLFCAFSPGRAWTADPAGSAEAVPAAGPAAPFAVDEDARFGSSNDADADVHPPTHAPPAHSASAAARETSALPIVLGIGVGYGFRPHEDGRNHGGTAHLYGDIPLAWGFGLRPEVLGFAYAPSLTVGRPFAHPMAAGSLVYAFDDTDTVAVVGVGGFVGLPLEVATGGATEGATDDAAEGPTSLNAGVLLSLGLRFRVLPGVRVEAGIRVPFMLLELPPPAAPPRNNDLRTQIGLSGGLVLVPEELLAETFASD